MFNRHLQPLENMWLLLRSVTADVYTLLMFPVKADFLKSAWMMGEDAAFCPYSASLTRLWIDPKLIGYFVCSMCLKTKIPSLLVKTPTEPLLSENHNHAVISPSWRLYLLFDTSCLNPPPHPPQKIKRSFLTALLREAKVGLSLHVESFCSTRAVLEDAGRPCRKGCSSQWGPAE